MAQSTVTMPRAGLIREHKRLVRVLRSKSHADDLREAKHQERELKRYQRGMRHLK